MRSQNILDESSFSNVTHNEFNGIFVWRICVFGQSVDWVFFISVVHKSFVARSSRFRNFFPHLVSLCVRAPVVLLFCVLFRSASPPALRHRSILLLCVLSTACHFTSTLSHITLRCVVGVLCTFCCIANCPDLSYISFCFVPCVWNQPSLPLLAISILSWKVADASTNFSHSIESVLDIPYLSMVTVLGKTSSILNWSVFEDINLLYEWVPYWSLAEVFIVERLMYTYGLAQIRCGALRKLLSWSPLLGFGAMFSPFRPPLTLHLRSVAIVLVLHVEM